MAGTTSILDFKDAEIPGDEDTTEAVTDSGLYCETCGKPLTYAGRGRKPRYCDEHRKGARTSTSTRAPRSSGSVDQAVGTLDNIYATLTAGFMMFGLTDAASSLAGSREYLAAQNRMFLDKDPALVKSINKAGAAGGRVGFFAVQIMTLGPVIGLAMTEIRARRAANTEQTDQQEAAPLFAGFGGNE